MKKLLVLVAVLILVAAGSTYAQTKDFFDLARAGTPQDVQAAISNGADVNARSYNGLTPLMAAAEYNQHPDMITVLLKAGTNIRARDKVGMTALMWAAWRNQNPDAISTLLKAGADAKAKNNKGYTASDYAQYNEYLKGTAALKQLEAASK